MVKTARMASLSAAMGNPQPSLLNSVRYGNGEEGSETIIRWGGQKGSLKV
jgi:hypothetical protein